MNKLNKIIIGIILILTINYNNLSAQALPIGLDGKYDDWTSEAASYTDAQGDGTSFDLLSFKVSNDSNFLFIQFALDQEIQLNYGNNLYLEIDGDNNASTGYPVNGIGAELGIAFGSKTFYFNHESEPDTVVSSYDVGFIALPTVTSDTFEIAIDRHAVPDGINPLFTSNTIKICFKSDDYMPDLGTTFSYTFDETPVESYTPVSFEKNNSSNIRLMTYNTLSDGLIDNQRVTAFQNIITAVNPDIITFNECWNTTQYQAKYLLNSWIPLSGTQWSCIKNDDGNITCSKYPITDYYDIDPTYINRITANLIDLPDSYPRDILVINAHLKAKGGSTNDAVRQEQADAVINFLRDVKNEGGSITLPYGTPFVISGDLNLVGSSQQQTTLLTGEIPGGGVFPPDWDNSNLNDIIAFHTDLRTATTWTEQGNPYWPGRFDYAIASDIGATVNKAFTICTHEMSSERLNQYGLNSYDTDIASDHLPKVTDFIIEDVPGNISEINNSNINIYPNPALNKQFSVNSKTQIKNIKIITLTGKVIYSKKVNDTEIDINLSEFPSGIYFVKIKTSDAETILKIILP